MSEGPVGTVRVVTWAAMLFSAVIPLMEVALTAHRLGTPEVWQMALLTAIYLPCHHEQSARILDGADALLLGRETYETFAATWPLQSGDPYIDRMNEMPKYVASRTLEVIDDWNAQLLKGDPAEAVAGLKKDGIRLLKFGTGEFDHSLLEAGLVDELNLWVFPVIAGTGDRLLDGLSAPAHFERLDSTTLNSGIVIHKYGPKPEVMG